MRAPTVQSVLGVVLPIDSTAVEDHPRAVARLPVGWVVFLGLEDRRPL